MSDLHVLLPLDGSAASDTAVGTVPGLGPERVTLVHAAGGTAVSGAYFQDVERRLRGSGVGDVRLVTQAGDAARVILDLTLQSGAGLIVLATHGQGGWDAHRLGAVAERVIRAASVPVLAVPQTLTHPGDLLATILSPQDGSELAEKSLERLVRLFPSRSPLLVTLLGVVETLGGPARLGGDDLASRFYQLHADELGERLRALAQRHPIAGSVRIELGSPARKILECAQVLRATLIALSTHGRGGIAKWTLGSVTEHVLRAGETPVLVVR